MIGSVAFLRRGSGRGTMPSAAAILAVGSINSSQVCNVPRYVMYLKRNGIGLPMTVARNRSQLADC